MQKSHENSNTGTLGTHALTTDPGNGFPSQQLRIDVIKAHDWPINDYGYTPVVSNLNKAIYDVISNNMVPSSVHDYRQAIFPKDKLRAETIPLDKIVPGKVYIINDKTGNVYLCKIEEINPGQSLRVHSLNIGVKDVLLRRAAVKWIAIVYMLDRQVISNEGMDQLCKIES